MENSATKPKSYYEAYWSESRGFYSGANQPYAANFCRWMADELADLGPNAPIIEVGCGDGSFTAHLARHSSRVTGIDIAAAQIEENSRRIPSVRFVQHDVSEPFPFKDSEFEVVWCSEVLEHLFDPEFALCEMHRILKPGGRLLVTVPYHGCLKDVLIALFKWDEHFAPRNPHIRFYTIRSLEKIACAAGFGSIRTKTCGMGMPLRDLFVPTNILLSAVRDSAGNHE